MSIQCPICEAQIRLGDAHCSSCGRKVTRDEVDALHRRWEASDPEAARSSDAVAYGRVALLIVAGLALIEALTYGVVGESVPTLVFCAVISASMVVLFFWGRRQPLAAMVVGLGVYLLLQGLAAIVSEGTLAEGILIKSAVLITLTGGISAELYRRKLEEERAGRRPG